MASNEGMNDKLRKFLLPGAASLIGAGAGLVLTRTNKLRDSLPSLDSVGFGDLAEDLRSKLSSTSGKSSTDNGEARASKARKKLDADELGERLKQRQERRKQRAGR